MIGFPSTAPDPCSNCGYQHGAPTHASAPHRVEIRATFVAAVRRLSIAASAVANRFSEELSLDDFRREAIADRKAAYRAARSAAVTRSRAATRPLEQRQYHRPRRTGRACGSRHQVMIT